MMAFHQYNAFGSAFIDGVPVKLNEKLKAIPKVELPPTFTMGNPSEVLFMEYDFTLEEKVVAYSEERRQHLQQVKLLEKKRLFEKKKQEELLKKQKEEAEAVLKKQREDELLLEKEKQKVKSSDERSTMKNGPKTKASANTYDKEALNSDHAKAHQISQQPKYYTAGPNILTPLPASTWNIKDKSKKQPPHQSNKSPSAIFNPAEFETELDPFDNMELKTLDDMKELDKVLQNAQNVPNHQGSEKVAKCDQLTKCVAQTNEQASLNPSLPNYPVHSNTPRSTQVTCATSIVTSSLPKHQTDKVTNSIGIKSNNTNTSTGIADKFSHSPMGPNLQNWNYNPYSQAQTILSSDNYSYPSVSSGVSAMQSTQAQNFNATNYNSSLNHQVGSKVEQIGTSGYIANGTIHPATYSFPQPYKTNNLDSGVVYHGNAAGTSYARAVPFSGNQQSSCAPITNSPNTWINKGIYAQSQVGNNHVSCSTQGQPNQYDIWRDFLQKSPNNASVSKSFHSMYNNTTNPTVNSYNSPINGYVATFANQQFDIGSGYRSQGQTRTNTPVENEPGKLRTARSTPDLKALMQQFDDPSFNTKASYFQSQSPPITRRSHHGNAATSQNHGNLPAIEKLLDAQAHQDDPYRTLTEEKKRFVDSVTSVGFSRRLVANTVQRLGLHEKPVLEFLNGIKKLTDKGLSEADSEKILLLPHKDQRKAQDYLLLCKRFKEFGFEEKKVQAALQRFNLDEEKTLDWLTTH